VDDRLVLEGVVDAVCSSLPAFMRVGELGMNLRLSIIWRNLSLDSS
jgi:hypothetical protein